MDTVIDTIIIVKNVIEKVLEKSRDILVGEDRIETIKYVDNQAESKEELQFMMECFGTVEKEYRIMMMS